MFATELSPAPEVGLVAQIGELAAKAVRVDARLVADSDLMALTLEITKARRALDATEAHALAELDVRGAAEIAAGMRTGAWLAREAHEPVAAARHRVRVARAVRALLPFVDDAFTEGRISFEHVRVFVEIANQRIAPAIAELAPSLVDLAEGHVVRTVGTRGSRSGMPAR